jgi:Flp pilus assembly protein CpaB
VQITRKRLGGPSVGGLLATRRGALTLALVCALAATGILIFAIGKYRHAVSGGTKQDTVLVATSEIPKGTAASLVAAQQLYKVTPVLASQVSAGAIVDAAALTGKIAATNIFPGQQLTSAEFTTGSVGVAAELSPSERAVAVTPDPAHETGVLQTGDHVDVYSSVASPLPVVSLLVPNAVVLRAPVLTSGASAGGSVLLGVSMQLAPRVMWAFDNGKIWLELRGLNSSDPQSTITGLRQTLLGDHLSATPTYTTTPATGTTP